jgi:hypothetical protein
MPQNNGSLKDMMRQGAPPASPPRAPNPCAGVGLECQVSGLANSDTCPRPTTQGLGIQLAMNDAWLPYKAAPRVQGLGWRAQASSKARPTRTQARPTPRSPGKSGSWWGPRMARSPARFRNRGTDSLSESGMERTSGRTKRQCDRTLGERHVPREHERRPVGFHPGERAHVHRWAHGPCTPPPPPPGRLAPPGLKPGPAIRTH